jgi:hypothetical protein
MIRSEGEEAKKMAMLCTALLELTTRYVVRLFKFSGSGWLRLSSSSTVVFEVKRLCMRNRE